MDNNKIHDENNNSTFKAILSIIFVICMIIPIIVFVYNLLGLWGGMFAIGLIGLLIIE